MPDNERTPPAEPDLFEEIVRLRAAGEPAALATVIGTRGSTPGKETMRVLVKESGAFVGTVGGGTGLPSQAAGLRILGLQGEGKRPALAEVAAALCLCGEISIVAAMASGDFARAHQRYARQRRSR